MKEKVKKLLGIVSMIICLSLVSFVPVMADDTMTDLETETDFAEDTVYSVLRGNNINFGTSIVKKIASNKVLVSGITQCHHNCDKVYLNLTLERKVDGVYSAYKTWSFTASNVSNLTKDITVIVPSGYYYRVRGYHAAKDGSKEVIRTVTKGVLVK